MSATRKFGIRGWQRLEGFYPPRIKPAEMLGHYAAAADVVETPNHVQRHPQTGATGGVGGTGAGWLPLRRHCLRWSHAAPTTPG